MEWPILSRSTESVCEIRKHANWECNRFSHSEVDPMHLLLGIYRMDVDGLSCTATRALNQLLVDIRWLRIEAEKLIQPAPDQTILSSQWPPAQATIPILDSATKHSQTFGEIPTNVYGMGSGGLLFALYTASENPTHTVLNHKLGIDKADLKTAISENLNRS